MESFPLLSGLHFQEVPLRVPVSAAIQSLEIQRRGYVPWLNPIALTIPFAASSILPSVLRTILIGDPHSIEHVDNMALVTSSSFLMASIDIISRFLVVSFILRL